MRNRVLSIAAISVMAAALLFFGFSLYQLSQPDVVSIEQVAQVVAPAVEERHSQEIWTWITIGSLVLVGVAGVVAAIIASEMRE